MDTNANAVEIDAATDFIVAEYSALRTEMGRYQDHQRQLFNTVFLVIGGTVTLATAAQATSKGVVTPATLLLCMPPLFAMLALLYLDRAVRIVRLAHYLHHHARARAIALSGFVVWEWEVYKGETQVIPRRVALALDRIRWSIFVVPLLAVAFYTVFGVSDTSLQYKIVAGCVGLVSLAVAVAAAFATEETSGVELIPRAN